MSHHPENGTLKTPRGSGPERILVIAASPIFGRSLERVAREMGFEVVLVRDDGRCLPDLAKHEFNLCFVQDALTNEMKRVQESGAPIIAFSPDAGAESKALASGASDFLKVPCRPEDLRRLIDQWLELGGGGNAAAASRAAAPASEARADAPIAAGQADRDREGTRDEPLILLVDDSHVIHSYVEGAAAPHGYRFVHAYDGAEGLEKIAELRPDLVISDIDMPKMNGYEMCKQAKASAGSRDIPILILSSRGTGIDIDRGFDVGANDFLTKPVSENELLSRIRLMLAPSDEDAEKRETVLVAEDSAVQRSVIVQALAQQGFRVLGAENGRECLDMALEQVPDLVVTDSEMPVMNGRELTRELKRNDSLKDVPVMMLTAADSTLNRAKGEHAGVSAYLTKPFVPDKVVVIAEKLIAERRLLRERRAMHRYLSDSAAAAASAAAQAVGDVDSTMRAETRFATIFFSDIVGFSPLTERMQAEQLVGLLNSYFDAVAPLFKQHGGVIDKLIGDAIMGFFVADEKGDVRESACNAVRTGLAMLETLKRFNAGQAESLSIRVGINSGDVVMGDIGSRISRRDYTVIGDHVNIAARLEGAATPGSVLISQSTYDLVKDRFEADPMGPISVKGRSEPVSVYSVRGIRNEDETGEAER